MKNFTEENKQQKAHDTEHCSQHKLKHFKYETEENEFTNGIDKDNERMNAKEKNKILKK